MIPAEITQNPDWIMWTAAMSPNREIFEKFQRSPYKYTYQQNHFRQKVPIK
ncbi:hypothetical protein [Bacteroides thetaiotaomicron]|uniref:hypothetical protein n=1 Tax=Bacteroides thetaiotaomicron TaxID=818 RepID=UPI00286DF2E2|nr:hypothetical protein [Bacteroides thetaiotaomicron]MCS2264260.1 DUF1793 domain-containing protein [Bacteroides thetaiotaomicron]